jgi:hypothetical protein
MKIAGSSRAPCGATKLHKARLMSARAQAEPTAPIRTPLKNIIHAVPRPAAIPIANAVNATLRLLVMIALDASGFTATIECVHISRRSMVSIMCGPRTKRSNPGSTRQAARPSTAPSRKRPVAAAV